MYYEQIDELQALKDEQIEIKVDARMQYVKSLCILKHLASNLSPLKSSASIDNKITSLLSIEDDTNRSMACKHHDIMMESEVLYKNARDKADNLGSKIVELRSRRAAEKEIK